MLQYKELSENYDYTAPDGSEIRLLPAMKDGSCAHCLLPAGKTSSAVKHKTVEEIWYVLSGEGEIWQKASEECTVELLPEICVTIPLGNHFQFRNTGNEPLCILIFTMPPWPVDKEEAIPVTGHWQ